MQNSFECTNLGHSCESQCAYCRLDVLFDKMYREEESVVITAKRDFAFEDTRRKLNLAHISKGGIAHSPDPRRNGILGPGSDAIGKVEEKPQPGFPFLSGLLVAFVAPFAVLAVGKAIFRKKNENFKRPR